MLVILSMATTADYYI